LDGNRIDIHSAIQVVDVEYFVARLRFGYKCARQ
jgi:hypothetical protein